MFSLLRFAYFIVILVAKEHLTALLSVLTRVVPHAENLSLSFALIFVLHWPKLW